MIEETQKPAPQLPQPVCPHCNKPVTFIQWMDFADGLIKVVYHKDCNKVLGITR